MEDIKDAPWVGDPDYGANDTVSEEDRGYYMQDDLRKQQEEEAIFPMEIKYDDLYMSIFDLDSDSRSYRIYSQEKGCYVVPVSSIENAFKSLAELMRKHGVKTI